MKKRTIKKKSFEEFFAEQQMKQACAVQQENAETQQVQGQKGQKVIRKTMQTIVACKNTLQEEAVIQLRAQMPVLEKQRARFNGVAVMQAWVALLLSCVVWGCYAFCPMAFVSLQQQYLRLFEARDYTPSLLRFTQQAVEVLAIEAQAADAPVGSSLAVYHTDATVACPVQNYIVSSAYGWRDDPFGAGTSFHHGIDLACAEGEAVFAAMDGVVERNYLSDSYGNCIYIRHADGTVTLYAHLQYAFARVGEVVLAGAQIGTVGQTGAATGAHLHFEVRVNNERLNPSNMLGLS